MGLINTIKNWFRKGGAAVGMVNSLSKITDDARISIDPKEYERIDRDIDYYSDKLAYVKYMNSYGQYKRRPRNTINMTKTAARRLASIIFNEKAEISIKNDQQTNDFINQVLLDNDFKNQFEEQLERGIAMGGFAMRPYVDNDKIKIAWVRADQFYPLHSNTNNISEAAIASKTTVTENHNNVYYTLLEFHQWQGLDYIITNELYRSEDPTQVGMQVPLNSLENYEDLANQVLITNFVRPLFVYFKTPGANNVTLDSPLGLGIVDNAKHILDNINTTHDQFIWEIRLGNRRIAVPRTMLKTDDAHPPMFDSEQNVYAPLLTDDMTQGVTDLTSDIRTQQYTDAMNHWIEELETQIGLSTGTFSYADSGLKTATEVASDNSMTYQTRSSYLTMVEKAIDGLCEAILELAGQGQLFSNGQPLYTYDLVNKPLEVECHFDDGIFVDKDKQLDEDTKTLLAGALSKQTFLQRNYGMSDEEVQQELAKIQDEAPETTPEGQQFEDETGGDGE